jgi:hypothetical protein
LHRGRQPNAGKGDYYDKWQSHWFDMSQRIHVIISFYSLPCVDAANCTSLTGEQLGGERPPPDSDPFGEAEFGENYVRWSRQFGVNVKRRFQFHKRSQLLIRAHLSATLRDQIHCERVYRALQFPQTLSGFHRRAGFRAAQSPTALLALARR